ncbi:outer dense fiber protein 3-like isoform X2 [Haliotis rubra]|uniref:outer dense fiber protein 3-like isoform X2 n=1 Tax=Haliotis rubra TaxID=36100 RepID=UPI001EE55110|nr:outer dense fiber protein 3-like isoform X2 [Haliotis rubra]
MPCVSQSVWKETRPRGPIAPMFGSPGPQYALPGLTGVNEHDPRSPHRKNPAYSFGVRHGKFRDDCGPGPAYLPEAKLYRDGRDGAPHYSLYSRPRDLSTHKTPGPGAYRPENAGLTSACLGAPKYSFGNRHLNRKSDSTPAPNAYRLPEQLGRTIEGGKKQAPVYSLRGRQKIGSFHEDLQKTPGPGNYKVTDPNRYKRAAPGYSMTSRSQLPGDTTTKPGPGTHHPELVYINKRSAPCVSFGIRHSQYTAPLIVDVRD